MSGRLPVDVPVAPPRDGRPDPAAPRVLGIDLSLTSTGLSDGRHWAATVTSKPACVGPSIVQRRNRIRDLVDEITHCYLLPAHDLVVVEGPSLGSVHGHQHERSWLFGSLVDRIVGAGLPLAVAPPKCREKYAFGKANCGKDKVLAAVIKRYGHLVEVDGNDQADAVALAAMGLDWLGYPLVPVPAAHRAALSGVEWPELVGAS